MRRWTLVFFFHISYSSDDTFWLSLLHNAYLDISLLQVTSLKNENYLLLRGTKINQNPHSEQKLLSL